MGLDPNVICQICHPPCHNATSFSIRFQCRQSSALPAMASFTPAEASETTLYPDSAKASHMTHDDSMLSAKIPYSGSIQVELSHRNLLPITNVENLSIQTCSQPLKLNYVLHVPQLKHNLLSVRCLERITVMFRFLLFVSRTTPSLKFFYRGLTP